LAIRTEPREVIFSIGRNLGYKYKTLVVFKTIRVSFSIPMIKKILFIQFIILLITGCFSLKPESRKISYYSLEYDPPKIAAQEKLPVIIRVERFRVAPFYDSDKIVFRDNAFKKDAYIYHKWWVNPGDMLSYFLARDIKETGLFKAVFAIDKSLSASHTIEGMVEEFLEEDSPDSWQAVLSLNITLMTENEPDISKRILLQKKYHATEPCKEKTPRSLAEAMSRAMSKISEMVITDILQSFKF